MRGLPLVLLITATSWVAGTAHAATCAEDIAAVDKALHAQYKSDVPWWDILACRIMLESDLRKDAIVTTAQIKEISYYRNIAYMQRSRGDEKMCKESMKIPKKLLRIW
jgi:hypothetical protein